MTKSNFIQKEPKWFFVVFLSIGTGLLLGAVIFVVNNASFAKKAIETTAVISEIRVNTNSEGKSRSETYVEYYVGNERYSGKIFYNKPGMYKGKEIQILYNKDNPDDFRQTGTGDCND